MYITFKTEIKDCYIIKHAYFCGEDYYFKVDKKYQDEITCFADPFIILLAFKMMEKGGPFHVKGAVSKSLLASLDMFTAYWAVMFPFLYKNISVTADEEFDDINIPLENKAIACFSGGLDSAAMLYRHKNKLAGRNSKNIERCIFIFGADIPLSKPSQFDFAFKKAELMCNDLSAGLIKVESNYRNFPGYWNMEHFALLAGVLRLWKNYPWQLIGSTFPVNSFMSPWSTNPVTDTILSSNRYKIFIDGAGMGRTEKAQSIKNWKTGLENLRVCWQNSDYSSNCGTCNKCTRTRLGFKAAGVDNLPCMPGEFDIASFKNMDFYADSVFYADLLHYVRKHNIKGKEFEYFEKKVKHGARWRFYAQTRDYIKKYLRYKLMSKITSGKRKQHYLARVYEWDRAMAIQRINVRGS